MTLFAVLLTVGCADQNRKEAPSSTYKGYWMVDEKLELVSQALAEDSCAPILEDKDLHKSNETMDLPIITIWGDGSIFALDSIIKTGAVSAKAHPESVTAANIPGRFVIQGRLFVEGTFTPSDNDGFTLAPFEVEELEEQEMVFSLDGSDVLTLEIKAKKSKDEGAEGAADDAEVAPEEDVAEEKAVETEEEEPFTLVYHRLTIKEYKDLVGFSQACLESKD